MWESYIPTRTCTMHVVEGTLKDCKIQSLICTCMCLIVTPHSNQTMGILEKVVDKAEQKDSIIICTYCTMILCFLHIL